MKTRLIIYWIATVLTALSFLSGGVGDLVQPASILEGMTHLGYPTYFTTILGVWKVLGAIVILAPRLPRLKEWAYAGMVFDLTGAAASHAATGDPVGKVVTPIAIMVVVIASWALRPERRRLGDQPRTSSRQLWPSRPIISSAAGGPTEPAS